MAQKKLTAEDLSFDNERQRLIMQVLLSKFADFRKREQHFYLLEGMSTSHLTLKAIENRNTLHAFWPTEHQRYSFQHGNIYMLEEDTIVNVQKEISKEINKLVKKGYIEKLGNENERRWRPVKDLTGVTL